MSGYEYLSHLSEREISKKDFKPFSVFLPNGDALQVTGVSLSLSPIDEDEPVWFDMQVDLKWPDSCAPYKGSFMEDVLLHLEAQGVPLAKNFQIEEVDRDTSMWNGSFTDEELSHMADVLSSDDWV